MRPWCSVRQEGPRKSTGVESGGNSEGNRGESEPAPAAKAATGTQMAAGTLGAPQKALECTLALTLGPGSVSVPLKSTTTVLPDTQGKMPAMYMEMLHI